MDYRGSLEPAHDGALALYEHASRQPCRRDMPRRDPRAAEATAGRPRARQSSATYEALLTGLTAARGGCGLVRELDSSARRAVPVHLILAQRPAVLREPRVLAEW